MEADQNIPSYRFIKQNLFYLKNNYLILISNYNFRMFSMVLLDMFVCMSSGIENKLIIWKHFDWLIFLLFITFISMYFDLFIHSGHLTAFRSIIVFFNDKENGRKSCSVNGMLENKKFEGWNRDLGISIIGFSWK